MNFAGIGVELSRVLECGFDFALGGVGVGLLEAYQFQLSTGARPHRNGPVRNSVRSRPDPARPEAGIFENFGLTLLA